jgi:mannitol-1-phosphate 5-dehydrogenase
MNNKTLIQFGAGKIGRSFIAQVFSGAGYETVFVDIDQTLIEQLNQKKQYQVVIKSDEGDEILTIKNIRAIHFDDNETIIHELSRAGIACLSVGQKGLPATIPIIARALLIRYNDPEIKPLDIIIAENIRNADRLILEQITPLLPKGFPLDQMLGLIETSIGKMVPIMTRKDLEEDPLQVLAEPYNTLIVAKNGFKNPIPEIKFLAPKDNIKAWVDRKLFIHNLGHSTLAYLAYQKNPEYTYIWQAAQDPELFDATYKTMMQSAQILMTIYPADFTLADLENHILDLLKRFTNKALGDTIFRVGCDLYRKLGPEDRFAAPLAAAIQHNLPFSMIFDAFKAGTKFRAMDENGNHCQADKAFFNEAKQGLEHILMNVSGFNDIQTKAILPK